jgi:hypothetical protein
MNMKIYTESETTRESNEPIVCTKPFDNENSRAGDADEPCENGEG